MATTKDKDKTKTGTTVTPTVTEPVLPTSSVIEAPALQTPTATYDDHYKTAYNNQLNTFTPGYEALKTANDEYLTGYDSSVDTQTAATTAAYQQQIDAASAMSRPLYDANAIDEKINHKKVQEAMANMGMTDSGLSSSMQTAMAIQKSNADHQVRQQERAYVQDLETAISNVIAQGESAKQAERARINKETADYYANGIANISSSAATAASDMVAADWDSALQLYGIENDNWQFLQGQAHDITMENLSHANEVELLGAKNYYEQQNMILQGQIDEALKQGDHERTVELEGIKATYDQALAVINGQIDLSKAQLAADADLQIAGINANQKNSAAYTDLVAGFIESRMSTNEAHINARYNTGNYETDEKGNLTANGANQLAWDERYLTARESGLSESDAILYANGGNEGFDDEEDLQDINDAAIAEEFVGSLGKLNPVAAHGPGGLFGDAGTGNWFGTVLQDANGDGRVTASYIKSILNRNTSYGKLSDSQKTEAIKQAIANAVYTGWNASSNDKKEDGGESKNEKRVKAACTDLGVDYESTLSYYYSLRV